MLRLFPFSMILLYYSSIFYYNVIVQLTVEHALSVPTYALFNLNCIIDFSADNIGRTFIWYKLNKNV